MAAYRVFINQQTGEVACDWHRGAPGVRDEFTPLEGVAYLDWLNQRGDLEPCHSCQFENEQIARWIAEAEAREGAS